MKRTISKEASFCDNCKEKGYVKKCLSCGVEHCWKCREKLGITYNYKIGFSGSRDGYFCLICDKNPQAHSITLCYLYKTIKALKDEYSAWRYAWDLKVEQAEQELENYLDKYKHIEQ